MKGERVEGLRGRYRLFDQVRSIPAGKFRRYHGQSLLAYIVDVKTLFLNARDFFRLLAGLHAAEKLVKQFGPDVVFSKGGYVAVPVGLAARLRGVPIVTHDSDSVPGLANRIIGRWAKVHASGMPPENYSYPKSTIVYTGIPVDERIRPVTPALQKTYRRQLGLPVGGLVLLAAGGGQGAQQINALMLAIAPKLLAAIPKLRLVHIVGGSLAGQMSEQQIKESYISTLPESDYQRVTTLSFTSDFYRYSGGADLIISRAGASTMAEFALQAKACIVIPSAALAGGHQLKNAAWLKADNAAKVLPAGASPEQLLASALSLLKDASARGKLATNLSAMAKPNAAKELADVILGQARTRHP